MTRNLAFRAAQSGAAGALFGFIVERSLGQGHGFLGLLVGILAGALTGYLLMRRTHRALSDLSAAALLLAEGDFDQRVPTPNGPAAAVSLRFNLMAGRLEEAFHAVGEEHARLEAVFDAATDALVALGPDTSVQFMNRAAGRLFETTFSHALGRPFIECARDYELDGLIHRAARPGSDPATALITFGAQRLPLRAAAIPLAAGGDWAVLLILTDLTEMNRVDQMRRDFVSNVSHELRTPLAAISAMAETIESGSVDPGEETEEFMRRIRNQISRLSNMVNELLDLSRIESGAAILHPEPIDLNALLTEAAGLVQPRATADGITIESQPAPGPAVEADRASVLRIATNLLDNAVKYSPLGGTITIATRDEGDLASFTVSDDGPGIAPQDISRVFERFYKGDPSRTGVGTGLGLAIVKHIVRNHGGTVEVTSAPGQGAAFTVRLPKAFVAAGPVSRR